MRITLAALATMALPAVLAAQGGMARHDDMAANPMVGGAAMYPSRDIIDNAVHSKDHTTLVAAVKAAGLVATLKGDGPFTVFAPTNAAFDKLPDGTVATLLEPANKAKLTSILTYHVVPGRWDVARIREALIMHGKDAMGGMDKMAAKDKMGAMDTMDRMAKMPPLPDGTVELTTVEGGTLWLVSKDGHLSLRDGKGDTAAITIADVMQKNGVIHVIDTVLMP